MDRYNVRVQYRRRRFRLTRKSLPGGTVVGQVWCQNLDAGTTADAGQLARQYGTSEGSIYAARRRARTKLWKRLKQSLTEE